MHNHNDGKCDTLTNSLLWMLMAGMFPWLSSRTKLWSWVLALAWGSSHWSCPWCATTVLTLSTALTYFQTTEESFIFLPISRDVVIGPGPRFSSKTKLYWSFVLALDLVLKPLLKSLVNGNRLFSRRLLISPAFLATSCSYYRCSKISFTNSLPIVLWPILHRPWKFHKNLFRTFWS